MKIAMTEEEAAQAVAEWLARRGVTIQPADVEWVDDGGDHICQVCKVDIAEVPRG